MAAGATPSAERRRIARAVVTTLLLVLVALAGYCRHLGYPGGSVYRRVPATAAAAPADRGTVAVFLSSDMGFNAGMGPPIAAGLARHGIAVLGVNTLAAFSQRRTPAEVTALVAEATRRALAWPGARRVVLIGQSFGANALLAGVGGLPPALKARVAMVELIVPAATMLFRATPGGVFDFADDGPALPIARRLDRLPVLCIHGRTEPGSLCPSWRQPNVRRVTLPGDHFLNDDTGLVVEALLRGMRDAAKAATPLARGRYA